MNRKTAFTIVELLITAAVGILVITGVLITILHSMTLDDFNEKFSLAMNIARGELETIFSERSDFANITTEEKNKVGGTTMTSVPLTYAANGLKGARRIEVTDVVPQQLKDVRILVCWEGRGRIWGDCECPTGQNCVFKTCSGATCHAPVDITTAIARR